MVHTCINVRTNNPFPEGYATRETSRPTFREASSPSAHGTIGARPSLVRGKADGRWPVERMSHALPKPSDDDASAPNTEKMSCAM